MQAANREDALLVVVERDGRVWFGSYPINPSVLPTRIREAMSHGAKCKVYIRADARAKYSAVAEVLDRVRSGFRQDGQTRQRPTPEKRSSEKFVVLSGPNRLS